MRLFQYCCAIALLLCSSIQSFAQGQNPTGGLQPFVPTKTGMKDYYTHIPKSWTRTGNDTIEPVTSREVLAYFNNQKMMIKVGGIRHVLHGKSAEQYFYEYNATYTGDGYRITITDLDEKKLDGGAGTYFQPLEVTIRHGGKTTKLQMRGLTFVGT